MQANEDVKEFSKDYWTNFNPICPNKHKYSCLPAGLWCTACGRLDGSKREEYFISLLSERFVELYNSPDFHTREFTPLNKPVQ